MGSIAEIWGVFLNTMFIVGVFNASNILIKHLVKKKDPRGLHTEELTLAVNVVIVVIAALLMI